MKRIEIASTEWVNHVFFWTVEHEVENVFIRYEKKVQNLNFLEVRLKNTRVFELKYWWRISTRISLYLLCWRFIEKSNNEIVGQECASIGTIFFDKSDGEEEKLSRVRVRVRAVQSQKFQEQNKIISYRDFFPRKEHSFL